MCFVVLFFNESVHADFFSAMNELMKAQQSATNQPNVQGVFQAQSVSGSSQEMSFEPLAQMTEDQVAQKIAAMVNGTNPSEIEGDRNGFKINGNSYLDAEGSMNGFAYDSLTGDITYMLGSANVRVFKYINAHNASQPLVIAQAKYVGASGWQITTLSGLHIAGIAATLTPKGILILRQGSAFKYTPGSGVTKISIPDGWNIAALQHGNIDTGYILLEKIVGDESKNPLAMISNITSKIGLTENDQYALLNIKTGQLFPLNIQVDDKNTVSMYNCVKKNNVLNVCQNSYSYESLYTNNGINITHYYWRVNWLNTKKDPVMISLEQGQNYIYITDLNTGKKVVAFHRTLGIEQFHVQQFSDGRIKISADWMFASHTIDDAYKFLEEQPDVHAPKSGS